MEYYLEMLRKSIKRLEADYDFSAIIDHNTSKGTFREHIVKQFLRPFLPGAYGVSGGQAFDEEGNISKQLDIVIYDAIHSYVAPYMDDFIYFPCESVYGNIEIKSRLDNKSFLEAVENIISLKKLKRKYSDTYQVTPIKELRIKGVTWEKSVTNEYFGIIFAYDGVSSEKVLEYIKEYSEKNPQNREYLPNIIVLLKSQTIISRYHRHEDGTYSFQPLKNFDGFYALNYADDILAEF